MIDPRINVIVGAEAILEQGKASAGKFDVGSIIYYQAEEEIPI